MCVFVTNDAVAFECTPEALRWTVARGGIEEQTGTNSGRTFVPVVVAWLFPGSFVRWNPPRSSARVDVDVTMTVGESAISGYGGEVSAEPCTD